MWTKAALLSAGTASPSSSVLDDESYAYGGEFEFQSASIFNFDEVGVSGSPVSLESAGRIASGGSGDGFGDDLSCFDIYSLEQIRMDYEMM